MIENQHSRYQIEADWLINILCNYSCVYCFSSSNQEHKLVGRISPGEYLDFFNKTGKTWLFHFTGGEPFLYPNFIDLCQTLSTNHFISINSNLSLAKSIQLIDKVSPEKVDYLHCGLHLEERNKHEGLKKVVDNLRIFAKAGFAVFVTLVMTPVAFQHFEQLNKLFSQIEVPLIPKALRGIFNGKLYPYGYDSKQINQFIKFAKTAEVGLAESRLKPFRNNPTVNPTVDQHFLDGFPDFSGLMCSAGKEFVRIDPDGRIYRCGKNTLIGDINKKELVLFPEKTPCDDNACPYMCLRYTDLGVNEAKKLPKNSEIKEWRNRNKELVEIKARNKV